MVVKLPQLVIMVKLIQLFFMQQKNSISAGLDALLGGGPARQSEKPEPERKRGFNFGHGGRSAIRNRRQTSLVIDGDKYDKIRHIAISNSLNINEVVDVAFDMVIEAYEKKYGPISTGESRISAAELIRSRKK